MGSIITDALLEDIVARALPARLWLALFLAPPEIGYWTRPQPWPPPEPVGRGYRRVAIERGELSLTLDLTGEIELAGALVVRFPKARGAWGTLHGYGCFDAPAGGRLLLARNCRPVTIERDDRFVWQPYYRASATLAPPADEEHRHGTDSGTHQLG